MKRNDRKMIFTVSRGKRTELRRGCARAVSQRMRGRASRRLHLCTRSVLRLAEHTGGAHSTTWAELNGALIKGFDQKKTHHLPSSPPSGTQWIHGQNDAGRVFLRQESEIRGAHLRYRFERAGTKGVGLKLCWRSTCSSPARSEGGVHSAAAHIRTRLQSRIHIRCHEDFS